MGWLDKYDNSPKVENGTKKDTIKKIDEVTVYSKNKYADELKKQQEKYLADMSKYKQDSAQWVKANQAYQDSLSLYNNGEAYINNLLGNIYDMPRKEYEDLAKKSGTFPKSDKNGINYFMSSNITKYEHDLTSLAKDAQSKKIAPVKIWPAGEYAYTRAPIFKKPTKEPISPIKPNFPTQVKYDPKYENLKMRSLWANQAKADTTSRIGTLNPLEYNDSSKGFTLREALSFPQEIKDQYNIDMIGKQAGIKRNGAWLEKYEDGGEVENPQRKYEREYQLYLQQLRQQQAQKGANSARKATTQFAKDYLEPIAKTVGSFTPAGVAIGLTDAYNSYREGDNTGAIIGAGLEVLPYGLKGVTKLVKFADNAFIPDSKLFKQSPNSMTRGIGTDDVGLNDLRQTGIVRGNPRGRIISPAAYAKLKKNPSFKTFADANPEITAEYASNNLSKSSYDKMFKYFEENPLSTATATNNSEGIKLARKPTNPLRSFDNYEDYVKNPSKTSGYYIDTYKDGTPMAFWYKDGQFPNYANYPSKNFLKLNNASKYDPHIPGAHLHPTTKEPIKLIDENLELYKTVENWRGKKLVKHINKENGGTVPLQNITNFTPTKKQSAKQNWLNKY
jgi:hypothetical protein